MAPNHTPLAVVSYFFFSVSGVNNRTDMSSSDVGVGPYVYNPDRGTPQQRFYNHCMDGVNLDIVKRLAADPDVDPLRDMSRILAWTVTCCRTDFVKFFLSIPGVAPDFVRLYHVANAIFYGELDMLKCLVAHIVATDDELCHAFRMRNWKEQLYPHCRHTITYEQLLQVGEYIDNERRVCGQVIEHDILDAIGGIVSHIPQWTIYLFLYNSLDPLMAHKYTTTVKCAIKS